MDNFFSCLKTCCCFFCELSKLVQEATFPHPNRDLLSFHKFREREDLIWLSLDPIYDDKPVVPTKCIPALHVKAGQSPAEYTIIYSHGNAEDLAFEQYFVDDLAKTCGMDVLIYEYPGYSLSMFTPQDPSQYVKTTETNINQGIEAAWRYLVNEQEVPPNRIIIFGRSIGSGPTIHLASRNKLSFVDPSCTPQQAAGVFLVSPFLSTIRAVCGPKMAITCCCYDKFPNHRKIHSVSAPVAVLHAKDDEVVKYENGFNLYQAVSNGHNFEPKWLESGGHNHIEPKDIVDYLLEFLDYIKNKAQSPIEVPENNYPRFKLDDKPILTDFNE